jgi:hypothetical protein
LGITLKGKRRKREREREKGKKKLPKESRNTGQQRDLYFGLSCVAKPALTVEPPTSRMTTFDLLLIERKAQTEGGELKKKS